MSTILLDFESRSEADLPTIGGRLYWRHPTTEAICAWLFEVGSGAWALWLPGDPCPVGPDDLLVAHNMSGFDRFAVAALGWRPSPAFAYVDTSELARVAGLPGSLDALAKRWLGREKNHAGNAVTRRLSGIKAPLRKRAKDGTLEWEVPPEVVKALKTYGGVGAPIPEVVLEYVVGYCREDVEVLVHGWPLLKEWQGADIEGVSEAERAVNERGVRLDVDLVRALQRSDAALKEAAAIACAEEMGPLATPETCREAAMSPKQFVEHTGAPNAQAETVKLIDHPLARLRMALASIAAGKLEAGLARVGADGRVRDMFRYYGAHTGRWSGSGMQLQNLPRPDKQFEEWEDAEVCALASAVLGGKNATQAEIDLLIRACLCASPGNVLVWGDYSAVEGRGLAWAAGDEGALDVYRKGLDPYIASASIVYGVPYDQVEKWMRLHGKILELACGYQGGEGAFKRFADAFGVDLSAIDVPAVIAAWRDGRRPTVQFWRDLQNAMIECVQSREAVRVGAFEFAPGDRDAVALILPSGRPIVYWGVAIEEGFQGRPSIAYEGLHFREHLYGGKIAENAIQGMCRDFLADALVRCERAGLSVVMHVHDELVIECAARDEERTRFKLGQIMHELPTWAAGFPPAANLDSGRRYRK